MLGTGLNQGKMRPEHHKEGYFWNLLGATVNPPFLSSVRTSVKKPSRWVGSQFLKIGKRGIIAEYSPQEHNQTLLAEGQAIGHPLRLYCPFRLLIRLGKLKGRNEEGKFFTVIQMSWERKKGF